MKKNNFESGFTLTELMIAVTVVGIVTAIAVPSYDEYIKDTHLKTVASSATTLAIFEDRYFLANDTYLKGSSVADLSSPLGWYPETETGKFTYSVTTGACGDIRRCCNITVKSVEFPGISHALSRP